MINPHSMNWITVISLSAAALIAATGCSSSPATYTDTVPQSLTLRLRKATLTNKYTYFELQRDGQLRYGGGRMAMLRKSQPIITLTSPQKQAVWDIIRKHHLLDVKGEFAPERERINWEVMIKAGHFSLGRTIRCTNDDVPGIAELHDLLFKIQSDKRFLDPVGIE